MRTPGRCPNIEGCWISASAKTVFIPLHDNFACPNCGTVLCPPSNADLAPRAIARPLAIGAATLAVCVGLVVGAASLVRADASAAGPQIAFAPASAISAPTFTVNKPKPMSSLAAFIRPTRHRTSHKMAVDAVFRQEPMTERPSMPDTERPVLLEAPETTVLSQATLHVSASLARPLVLPVTFGRPEAPDDEEATEDRAWHDRSGVRHHHRVNLARTRY